jgi:hypothetical protein
MVFIIESQHLSSPDASDRNSWPPIYQQYQRVTHKPDFWSQAQEVSAYIYMVFMPQTGFGDQFRYTSPVSTLLAISASNRKRSRELGERGLEVFVSSALCALISDLCPLTSDFC